MKITYYIYIKVPTKKKARATTLQQFLFGKVVDIGGAAAWNEFWLHVDGDQLQELITKGSLAGAFLEFRILEFKCEELKNISRSPFSLCG